MGAQIVPLLGACLRELELEQVSNRFKDAPSIATHF